MKTVYHPSLTLVSNEVEDDAVEAWVAQGWRKSEPKESVAAREAGEGSPRSFGGESSTAK